jgi:hypothetical protein
MLLFCVSGKRLKMVGFILQQGELLPAMFAVLKKVSDLLSYLLYQKLSSTVAGEVEFETNVGLHAVFNKHPVLTIALPSK